MPGNSQQVVAYRAPRAGLHPWAAGHTDPHSALGTTALAGVLVAKSAMERFGLCGTLLFFGEPAEKVCGSKPVHAAKGYYDGADAFIPYHPHFANTAIWDTQCGSYWSVVFTSETVAPEKWIDKSLIPTTHTSHAAARCPGAIDALCLMYTTTKYTKEAMFPHTGTWTWNEFVLVGGEATSDNLPQRFSQIQYMPGARRASGSSSRLTTCSNKRRARGRYDRLPRVGAVDHQDAFWPHQSCDGRSDIQQYAPRRPAAVY